MSRHDNQEDRMLIVKAKSGDSIAYESLVRKYQKSIYFLCHRMTGAHQSADDLSQETFVKAYFSLSKFKEEMNFFTWIRKIAVNSTLNYLKIRKREKPLGRTNQDRQQSRLSPRETPEKRLEHKRMEKKFQESLHSCRRTSELFSY